MVSEVETLVTKETLALKANKICSCSLWRQNLEFGFYAGFFCVVTLLCLKNKG